jgi:hypothetical protein
LIHAAPDHQNFFSNKKGKKKEIEEKKEERGGGGNGVRNGVNNLKKLKL